MKTFLNVLYRRILYKIPLKLLLVLLAIFGLLFACTKADFVVNTNGDVDLSRFSYLRNQSSPYHITQNIEGMTCVMFDLQYPGAVLTDNNNGSTLTTFDNWALGCSNSDDLTLTFNGTQNLYYFFFSYDNWIEELFPKLTSQQCQSEYNLIPISEVDSSYCQSNNLCPSGGTPSDCPNVGVSNLFINDIFHPGAFNIIMNIPEEISRDYAYTNSGYNFNLDIEGYNVDYEKMQSVIDNQSYIPTEEDFQNIISILTPYTKIIVFFVFLFIVWAWIKKPFKSKKL